jgi:zinc/manganese transport system permease protein
MKNDLLLYVDILWPAFCAGLLVLSTHIPLGREVLKRGIIFLDLAIAQIAGMGIILAGLLGLEPHGWELQSVALLSAMTGALILSVAEKLAGAYQEAIIGCVFVLAATGSLLMLSSNPQGGEHLQQVLVGQILWVEWKQLLLPLISSVFILAFWFFKPELFSSKIFYLLFAIAITNSVQLVGVYLVFASLILPAITTLRLETKSAITLSFFIGALGYLIGLVVSSLTDLPSGAVIVWVMACVSFLGSLMIRNLKQVKELN